MPTSPTVSMAVYVCDDLTKATSAQNDLLAAGYAGPKITVEQVNGLTYDAQTYDGGMTDAQLNKYVVIGRK